MRCLLFGRSPLPLFRPAQPTDSGADTDSLSSIRLCLACDGRATWPAMVQAWLKLGLGMLERRALLPCGTNNSPCHDPRLRLRLGPGLSSDNALVLRLWRPGLRIGRRGALKLAARGLEPRRLVVVGDDRGVGGTRVYCRGQDCPARRQQRRPGQASGGGLSV